MTRRRDFAERLLVALDECRDRPFAWGRNDCALLACGLVEAATGVDYAAPFRGRYRPAAGAARALRRFLGPASPKLRRAGLLEAVAEKITRDSGLEEVPPLMAQRGDFVLVDETESPALGVCLGSHIVAAGPMGTVLRPLAAARRAWRT